MKLRERFRKPYGLQARLGLAAAVSTAAGVLAFLLLNAACGSLIADCFAHTDLERIQVQRQFESLQEYITENRISSHELVRLREWEKKQPVILLELYAEDRCIYSSVYDAPVSSLAPDEGRDTQEHRVIELDDRPVTAYVFSDFTYRFSVIGTAVSLAAAVFLFTVLFLCHIRQLIGYICRLNEQVQILEGGNLEYCLSVEGNDELTELARSMNRMRETIRRQMETEQQLHRANRQMITEMSHDLRTPLTGIMLYLEILRSRRYESEEQLQGYLEKIDAKAHHMKLLSDHLFEYAMQDTPPKQAEPRPMEAAFGPALAAMRDDLRARGFSVEAEPVWEGCFVQAEPEYVSRIFENITSNIQKYAEPAAAVTIETLYTDSACGFSVMNTICAGSPAVESSGVGIESVRSMMKQMGGSCGVERTDTAFAVTLLFPKQ